MGNGEGAQTASRELAPALTGRELGPKDPSIMEQWSNEIQQATQFVDSQMCRLRNQTDGMFGPEPREEEAIKSDRLEKIAEVRPQYDIMGSAINRLHNATQALSMQLDRLEGHRLV